MSSSTSNARLRSRRCMGISMISASPTADDTETGGTCGRTRVSRAGNRPRRRPLPRAWFSTLLNYCYLDEQQNRRRPEFQVLDRSRMKVVLFCGGLGMRIREAGENIPKPMVTIGYRPILWHVMKYYAHFGHKDFVLCLGYRGDVIKDYFLNYSECLSNDFVLSEGGKKLELMASDIHDWKITFVETGATSNIGQRLKAVERHVRDEPEFLANYSDGLTDLPLNVHLEHFRQQDAVASFVSVKPNLSYHLVSVADGGRVTAIEDIRRSPIRINGGFFALRREIFD